MVQAALFPWEPLAPWRPENIPPLPFFPGWLYRESGTTGHVFFFFFLFSFGEGGDLSQWRSRMFLDASAPGAPLFGSNPPTDTLYLPIPFFSGILLSSKPLETQGNSWFSKRTMVEKNGESTPRTLDENPCSLCTLFWSSPQTLWTSSCLSWTSFFWGGGESPQSTKKGEPAVPWSWRRTSLFLRTHHTRTTQTQCVPSCCRGFEEPLTFTPAQSTGLSISMGRDGVQVCAHSHGCGSEPRKPLVNIKIGGTWVFIRPNMEA